MEELKKFGGGKADACSKERLAIADTDRAHDRYPGRRSRRGTRSCSASRYNTAGRLRAAKHHGRKKRPQSLHEAGESGGRHPPECLAAAEREESGREAGERRPQDDLWAAQSAKFTEERATREWRERQCRRTGEDNDLLASVHLLAHPVQALWTALRRRTIFLRRVRAISAHADGSFIASLRVFFSARERRRCELASRAIPQVENSPNFEKAVELYLQNKANATSTIAAVNKIQNDQGAK